MSKWVDFNWHGVSDRIGNGWVWVWMKVGHVLVPPHVEPFGKEEEEDVVGAERDEHLVPTPILGLVVVSIDLREQRSSISARWPRQEGGEGLTFDPMMLLACTNILYSAEATVRVRTEPALRLVMATLIACT